MMLPRFACVLFVVAVTSAGPASFIKKCVKEDFKCQTESAQIALPFFADGIPEIQIEKLDPLYYKKLDASSKNLKLILQDMYINGVKNCRIKKMHHDVANSKMELKALCTLSLDGQYEMDGRILIIPIVGKGKVTATLNKVLLSAEANIVDVTGKDGKTHWDIKSWKYTYELTERAEIDLENLFPGNEVLGNAASALLKSSPNEVIDEVGPPIIKAFIAKAIKMVDKFFKHVPVEDLVL